MAMKIKKRLSNNLKKEKQTIREIKKITEKAAMKNKMHTRDYRDLLKKQENFLKQINKIKTLLNKISAEQNLIGNAINSRNKAKAKSVNNEFKKNISKIIKELRGLKSDEVSIIQERESKIKKLKQEKKNTSKLLSLAEELKELEKRISSEAKKQDRMSKSRPV